MSHSKLTRLPVLAILATALLLLVAPAAHAMKLKSQNLTQLISESQSIVHGTVKSVTDGIADNGLPYTEITMHVANVAKGKIEAESDYTFRQFGLLKPRTFANGKTLLAVSPEGFARWREGETVVAFLYKPASRTGLQTTTGMAQGKLSFINGSVMNEFNNAGLFEGVEIDNSQLSDEQINMMTQPGAVDGNQFMDLVGRAVSEQWIEKGVMK